MGRSGKSYNRKTDKETQSPMLKIFRDIMQRENDDPEKKNLLKEHHDHQERKRKQHSGSKSKSDNITPISSGTERFKRTIPYNAQEQRNLEYEEDRRQSIPFQSDKKESWWFWGDKEKTEREETCSCVSCALEKLAGSEFMCIGCLLTIFTLSVVVAFLMVFRSVPTIAADETDLQKPGVMSESERLKRKIDLIQERKRELSLDLPSREKKPWEDSLTRPLEGLSAISGDFDLSSFRDLGVKKPLSKLKVWQSLSWLDKMTALHLMNNLEIGSRSARLSSVLDSNNMHELQNSDRLREFYKKLIQTDAQINMLKKGATDLTHLKTDEDTFKNILDRTKRSLSRNKYSNNKKRNNDIVKKKRDVAKNWAEIKGESMRKNNEDDAKNTEETENDKMRKENGEYDKYSVEKLDDRSSDERNQINDATKGIVIEKKRLLVNYKPGERKKVPKCSHAPKDAKSHEKQLKHPFYKNTQRLDELLDKFMEKSLPEILSDPFGSNEFYKNGCKHPNVDGVKVFDKIEVEKTKTKPETSRELNKNVIYEATTEPSDIVKPSDTEGYDMVLSISTLLSPEFKTHGDISSGRYLGKGFNHRKLMQANEVDEDNLGYEDLKEVLIDDLEGHDDTDNHGERGKRNEELKLDNYQKYQPPGVHNQNWKGPMPIEGIDPDEIKSMIKHAALSANNPEIFKTYQGGARFNAKEESPEIENAKHDVNDVQYIEDYLTNKYDKLAQAYSDYGVLDGKKESVRNDKDEGVKTADHRVKLSIDKGFFKGGIFDRLKKGSQPSEGIRFEVRPSGSSQDHSEDDPLEVSKYIHKHIKISHDKSESPSLQAITTYPTNEELELMYTPKKYDIPQSYEKSKKKYKNDNLKNGLIFAINKGKRSLKSIDIESDLNEVVENGTDIFDYKDKLNTDFEINSEIRNLKESDVDVKKEMFNNSIVNNAEFNTVGTLFQYHNLIKNVKENIDLNDEFNYETENVSTYLDTTEKYNNSMLNINDEISGLDHLMFKRESKNNLSSVNDKNIDQNETFFITKSDSNQVTAENGKETIANQFINNSRHDENSSSNKTANASDGMSLSDLFMMLVNFFSFLDGVNVNDSKLNSSTITNDRITTNDATVSKNTTEILYPVYDSEITENIGHRSRILLSMEEKNISEAKRSYTEDDQFIREMNMDGITPTEPTNATNATIYNLVTPQNATKPTIEPIFINSIKDKNVTAPKNKTIVKRNAEETNLIFWNDMYDDEYGVKVDHLENNVRDKHSAKLNNIVKSSGVWLQDKVRKLADNFRKKTMMKDSDGKQKKSEVISKSGSERILNKVSNKINKRDLKMMSEEGDADKIDFVALTANMKEVCRKAAKDVKHTRNIEVREASKETAVASTLMQQLVRLMTDLVDFQVQQRTCLKLPPDLQNFLEWLTGNDKTEDMKMGYQDVDNMMNLESIANYDKTTENYLDLLTATTEKEVQALDRSECLNTLHDVQDLMQQYEVMGEEDKSKMTGIKEYLESQMDYLQKQINSMDFYNSYQKTDFPLRLRRSLLKNVSETKNKQIPRRNLRKFIKTYGKKHTKTTASLYEVSSFIDINKNVKFEANIPKTRSDHKVKDHSNNNANSIDKNNYMDDTVMIEKEKRNLKDVYYKAIADAKKFTTVKHF